MPDYGVKIPVEVTGREQMRQLYDGLRGVNGATRELSPNVKEFLGLVRDLTPATGNFMSALGKLVNASRGVTQEQKEMARSLANYISQAREAEAQTIKLERVFAKVGGRLGGIASGIPGGGFIGSQVIGGLGLSGGAALGVGGAATGLFAAFEIGKQVEKLGEWAQAQSNAAKAIGITVDQQQRLSRISELTGTKIEGAAKEASKLSEEFTKGGARAKEIESALARLGLPLTVAFSQPYEAVDRIAQALAKIPSQIERVRIAEELLKGSGTDLAVAADRWNEAKGKSKILDEAQIKALSDAHMQMKLLGEEWDLLIAKAAKPVKFVVQFINESLQAPGPPKLGAGLSPAEFAAGVRDGTLTDPLKIIGGPRPYAPGESGGGGYQSMMDDQAGRRASIGRQIQQLISTGIKSPGETAEEARLRAGITDASASIEAARVANDLGGVRTAVNRKNSLEAQLEATRKLQSERERFSKLPPLSELSLEEAAGQGKAISREFPLMSKGSFSDRAAVQGRLGQILHIQSQLLEAPSSDFQRKTGEQLITELVKGFNKTEQEGRKFGSDQTREASEFERIGLTRAKGEGTLAEARVKQQAAVSKGAESSLKYQSGVTPAILARIEYEDAVAQIQRESTAKTATLTSERKTLLGAADKITSGEESAEGRRAELLAQADQKKLDLDSLDIDSKTKLIEATNKLNDAVDEAAKRMRDEFGGIFESVILGAQRGGGRGASGALKSAAEGIEGQFLKNIGGAIFGTPDKPGIAGAAARKIGGKLPDWITQGTIFGNPGQKNPELLANTSELKDNTKATRDLNDTLRSMGRGAGGGASGTASLYNLPGRDATLSTGTFDLSSLGGDITTAGTLASSVAGAAGASGAGAQIATAAKNLGAISKDLGTITSGKAPASIFSLFGQGAAKDFQAVAGLAAAGVGAFESISTITHGGAKNALGGIGGLLGSASILGGPAAPFLAAGGAALGLISSFLPDPKQVRANQISKNIFTDQYQAPIAQNLSVGANGGYSDADIYGNVRSSHFSPYAIVSNPYLDVPRRTNVPGTTISAFGGYQNQTGAQRPPAGSQTYNGASGTPITIQVQTMDAKSFLDHADKITDAVHLGIQQQGHPIVNTLAQQMGTR